MFNCVPGQAESMVTKVDSLGQLCLLYLGQSNLSSTHGRDSISAVCATPHSHAIETRAFELCEH